MQNQPLGVPVDGEIRLGQLLKLAGVADSGAQARELLAEGEVQVNGEVDMRRGRQLSAGDVVVVSLPDGDQVFRVE
ncbi:MAG: RNA-binding S4 domain-containing protein [Cellulomonadaceae bacterium]|nr:RNA-binding S4 domain-containing protein [Cellulomonadaceae bacterium]